MVGGNAAVDDRHADAAAVHLAERRRPRPPTPPRAPVTAVVSAMCERTSELPDTASNSPSCASASSSAPRRAEHRARRQQLLDPQAVTLRQPIDRFRPSPVTMTSIDAAGGGIEVRRQIRRQPRAPRARVRRGRSGSATASAAATHRGDVPRSRADCAASDAVRSVIGCEVCVHQSLLQKAFERHVCQCRLVRRRAFLRPNPSARAGIRRASGWCAAGHRESGSKRCGARRPAAGPPARCSRCDRAAAEIPAGVKCQRLNIHTKLLLRHLLIARPVPTATHGLCNLR